MRFWILLLLPLALTGQTLSFEVASVRFSSQPSTPKAPCSGSPNPESLLDTGIHTFRTLVTAAYDDQADDFDLPVWTNSSRFALSVKIPPHTTVAKCREMLRNLLTERFHLVLAEETRQLPRYSLKVAKSGLKLKLASQPAPDQSAVTTVPSDHLRLAFRGASMARIVTSIENFIELDARFRRVERFKPVVVDQTGLSEYYDGGLDFTLPPLGEKFPATESLEDAVLRQLGLTLEMRKVPGRVLVLRSADQMPTDN